MRNSIILCFIVLLGVLSCNGCEDSTMVGGYEFCNIYILDESEVIEGQNTTVNFNREGGSQVFTIVSPAQLTIQPLHETNGIIMRVLDDCETYEWTTHAGENVDYIKQSIIIEASDNNTRKIKTASYYVVSMIYNGYASKFTIKQSK